MVKLEELRYDAISCPRCSNCKWIDHIYVRSHRFAKICPLNARHGFNAYSAHGLLDLALAVMDGRLGNTPGLLDATFKCLLCGACDVRCKRNLDIEVLQVIEALRRRLVENGWGPPPALRELAERILRDGNRYGAPLESRLRGFSAPRPAATGKFVYFVGCHDSYVAPEAPTVIMKLLSRLGVEAVLLPEERCCGKPLFAMGEWDKASELAHHNLEAITRSGAEMVIISCPECYHTLKVEYPRLLEKNTSDLGFEVVHITELLASRLAEGRIPWARQLKLKAAYHDPCHLGRLGEPWYHWKGERKPFGITEPPKIYRRGHNGVYQPPREVLQSLGVELIELERSRENAWCCGAGGGVRIAFKDFALWTARERLKEAHSLGVKALVTVCPYCRENFKEADGFDIEIYSLTELMGQALE